MIPLSIAKRVYEKNYEEKRKTESGGEVRVYSPEHVAERWKKKVKKLKEIEHNIGKLRKKYKADLHDKNNAKTRAIAAMVGLIDNTAIRVGNDASAEEAGTFGATTLERKHATVSGNKIRFKFKGKDGVAQNLLLDDAAVASEIKKLLKGKKDSDYIFEYEPGARVSAKMTNNYLSDFGITAKDIRGFFANTLLKKKLKSEKYEKALEETALEVGHESRTLENQYLDPATVKKYKKKASLPPLFVKYADYKKELENEVDNILRDSPNIWLSHRPAQSVAPTPRKLSATQSLYMHLSSANVRKGQSVSRSDVIGSSGHSGAVTGAHLHMELIVNGSHVNPVGYAKAFYPSYAITSPYGHRAKVLSRGPSVQMHEGVDIGLPDGTPVYAMADSIVSDVKSTTSGGNMVVLTHYV